MSAKPPEFGMRMRAGETGRARSLTPAAGCTMQGMGSAKQTSTIVKAAARRQLRGDGPTHVIVLPSAPVFS